MQVGFVFVVCDRNRWVRQACICNHGRLYTILLLTSNRVQNTVEFIGSLMHNSVTVFYLQGYSDVA